MKEREKNTVQVRGIATYRNEKRERERENGVTVGT
jgi:hypothetical protein